jgi:hypothetical protein
VSPGTSPIWQASRRLNRVGLAIALFLIAAGVGGRVLGAGGLATWLLGAGCASLGAVPAASLLVAGADHARRRDWIFVGATLVVLAVVAFSIARVVS